MTTHTDLLAGGRHTYWLGERLAAIARSGADGERALRKPDLRRKP